MAGGLWLLRSLMKYTTEIVNSRTDFLQRQTENLFSQENSKTASIGHSWTEDKGRRNCSDKQIYYQGDLGAEYTSIVQETPPWTLMEHLYYVSI